MEKRISIYGLEELFEIGKNVACENEDVAA